MQIATPPRNLQTPESRIARPMVVPSRRLGFADVAKPLNRMASSLLPDKPASDLLTPRPGAVDRGDMMKDWTLLLPAAVIVAALAILVIVARNR